jgi:hypothetical protein
VKFAVLLDPVKGNKRKRKDGFNLSNNEGMKEQTSGER